ncbi:two-component system, NarL family, sensor histidine kinase DesK [Streptomyces sp. LamerLS-316]|nr:two-component system, NarL family, sensor histidine kinase DesK [Streptomyces sp. LamerLS-316]
MWVRAQVHRWQRREGFDKIDLYTRGTLHSMVWGMVLCVTLLSVTRPVRHSDAPAALIVGTVLAGLAQGACATPLVGRALDGYLGRAAGTRWLSALAAVLFLANAAGLLALGGYAGTGTFPELRLALGAVVWPFLTPFVLVVPVWASSVCVVAIAGAMSGGALLAGATGPFALTTLAGVGFGGVLLSSTVRLSAWTLGIMQKLREAQDVETRLAVAEERLRFGRDMHDVLGRNLAVIALKSELAVELAQRGKPAATDQMVEVQRIARASQQEVRDVVRGYREADLRTELLGAQGVLRAAGIECAVQGDGGRLPAEVQSALGWAVREAATNVLRHGDPQRCDIRLETARDGVRLVVENDGVTPDKPVAPGGGSGLHGLRERLAAVGGSLEAGPTAGGLFTLTAAVPLPPPPYTAAGPAAAPRSTAPDPATALGNTAPRKSAPSPLEKR